MRYLFVFIIILITHDQTIAGEITGYSAIDTRVFFNDPTYIEQNSGIGYGFVLEPEYYTVSDNEAYVFTFRPFFRADSQDNKRTHADIRQLDLMYISGNFELRLGISKVFWGVIETKHLVDIINQTDLIENIDREQKLGQPMVQFSLLEEWGTLRFFVLPYFRERTFPGEDGRLRSETPVDTNTAVFVSTDKNHNIDYAIRYEHTFGNWDLGLAYFTGTSRDPTFKYSNDGSNLIPHYALINQLGLDLQYTDEAWLWKLETIGLQGYNKDIIAMSIGVEYTYYDIQSTGLDIGILLENHYDSRDDLAPPVLLEDDIFIGFRIALNDVESSQLLGGVMIDKNDGTQFYSLEASQRINNYMTIELLVKSFSNTNINNLAYSFRNDDHLEFRIAWYF